MSAIMSLRLQAEAGDPSAQVQLARASLLGRAAPFAPTDALRLLDAACGKDWPDALLLRAALSVIGLATPRNYDEALRLLARAAAAGDPRARGQLAALTDAQGRFDLEVWRAQPQATLHFRAPRLITLKNFIPEPARAWLIAHSRDKLQPATQWNESAGRHVVDSNRTNSQTIVRWLDADIVSLLVNLRIAAASGAPLLHQEPTILLRYEVGQQYKPHFDFIATETTGPVAADLQRMGQRVATLLIYLNDDYEGGETAFPQLNWRFKGEAGDALLFWNFTNAEPEVRSLHAGLPVTQGEKWLLSKWIRAKQVPLWWPDAMMPKQ